MGKEKNVNLLTTEGYEKLNKELKHREGELRESLSETLNEMREQGDLRENDGYTLAVEENEQNEEEILRIKELLRTAKVVEKTKKKSVDLGSTVTIVRDKGDKRTYTIVGEDNTNPLEQKISYKSPLGSTLMGKKIGEKVTLKTPKDEISYKIENIE